MGLKSDISSAKNETDQELEGLIRKMKHYNIKCSYSQISNEYPISNAYKSVESLLELVAKDYDYLN